MEEVPVTYPPVEEPDLHDVGPTPRSYLGVPDPDEVDEDKWLEENS